MLKYMKKHYHWIVAVVVFLMLAIDGGTINTLPGLHVVPVSEDMGISRAQFSLAISLKNVVAFISTLLSGILMVKFGFRTMATIGLCMSAGAYFFLSQTDSHLGLALGICAIGLSAGFCSMSGANRIISTWFHRHKGAVLGFVSAATGFGGSAMTILQSAAIARSSWRASFLLAAILLATMGVVLFLLIRNRPQSMNLLPLGDGEVIEHKESKHHERLWEGRTMKELTKGSVFYLMILATFLSCLSVYLVSQVCLPYMQGAECLTLAQASGLYSILLLVMSGTKFLAGALCDSIGAKKITVLCLAFNAAGILALILANSYLAFLGAMLVFSIGLPLVTVTIPLLATELFGYKAQAEYSGIFLSMTYAATIIAAPISNAVFDAVHSYHPAFFSALALSLVTMLLYLLLYRLAGKDQARWKAEQHKK